MTQLPILPILLPLLGAAVSLFVEHRRIGTVVQRSVAWTFMAAIVLVAILLVLRANEGPVLVYLLGDWPARIGIALMVDRLSALMVLTTSLLGVACLLHACSGWDRRAPHFHALFMLQLMGLNGAFLTGDIFNLFVFFEVMLIASYGLLLSGGRGVRMSAGLHYVVFNITASTLFLIALGLIYGVFGTLNMAELAERVANVPPASLPLAKATIGLLLVVFCAKAALLPLYLWLPETYTRAPAAVAALFAIMTKVGIYAVLRVSSLMLGNDAGAMAGYGWDWMLPAAVGGLALATLGVLAASRLRVLVAYVVLVSATTLFIAFGLRTAGTIAAGLYYLVHSSFVAAALFLVADLVRRGRGDAGDALRAFAPAAGVRVMAGVMFMIGAISVAGLPPLSGFVGKTLLLQAVPEAEIRWVWPALLGSSMLVIVGLTRAGTRIFWKPAPVQPSPPGDGPRNARGRLRLPETIATMLLLSYGVAMSVTPGPLTAYTRATAEQLLAPATYIDQVRGALQQERQP
ncbi:MAG TPA: monovalent cation/H+ antiporter subunit D [Luteimonas sp.]|nr:monovalent cation/H+ antiporter subunit D [Luteimonas sp.]HRP72639.1 monovalent cation/H+ antiporter subunit D [Luteimonas sp.]